MRQLDLGPEGIQYVRQRLQNPPQKMLSRLVLEHLDLDSGMVQTFIPENLPQDQVANFSHGKYIPLSETTAWLIDRVSNVMALGRERVCTFENSLALPGDPALALKTTRRVFCGNDVYHILEPQENQAALRQKLELLLKESGNAYPESLGFVGIYPKSLSCGPTSQIAEIGCAVIEELARTVEMIIVGAYDAEGYVIWEKISA